MTAPSPLPPPSPMPAATPPKKSRTWLKIGGGCLGIFVLGCVLIGAFALYENWQQEKNYEAGHSAYVKADCASAHDPLDKAARGEPGTKDSDVARKAQAELQECDALTAADKLSADKPADAVVAYSAFVAKYANSPLKDAALTKGQQVITDGEPADVAAPALCESLDDLVDKQFIAQPDDQLPPLVYACGQAYEASSAPHDALAFYERFLSDYPDHALAAEVTDAYARTTIADAQASGAGELPPPQAVGASDQAGEQVMVVIQNDSPEELSLIFSGPEVRVERLEPCADCEKFSGDGPSACPEKGPVGKYLLNPGSYDVVVKAAGKDGVTPFRGNWSLESGQEYSSCFYLVTGGGS